LVYYHFIYFEFLALAKFLCSSDVVGSRAAGLFLLMLLLPVMALQFTTGVIVLLAVKVSSWCVRVVGGVGCYCSWGAMRCYWFLHQGRWRRSKRRKICNRLNESFPTPYVHIFLISITRRVDLAISVCPYERGDLGNYKSKNGLPAQRKFVSAGCHINSNAYNRP